MERTLEQELGTYLEALATQRVELRVVGGKAEAHGAGGGAVPLDVAETVALVAEEAALVLSGKPVGEGWRSRVESWPTWLVEEWEERAAIREYEALFPRKLAELLAYRDVLARKTREKVPPAPETFRATACGGESWVWSVDEMFVALDEAFEFVGKVRAGERTEDTEAVQRLRDVVGFEAGVGALQRLVWMVGEATDSEY